MAYQNAWRRAYHFAVCVALLAARRRWYVAASGGGAADIELGDQA